MGVRRWFGWGLLCFLGSSAGACGSERREAPTERAEQRTALEESAVARARIRELRIELPGRGTAANALGWLHEDSPRIGFEADASAVYPVFGESSARVAFPKRANDGVRLADVESGLELEFALQDANAAAEVEVAGGLVVYRNALTHADLVHRARVDGTEDFLVFERAPRVSAVSYRVSVSQVAGLRLVENTLEFLDRDGAPRLRVAPPFVIDAEGRRFEATLEITGCNVDQDPRGPWGRGVAAPGASECTLALRWSKDVRAPFVVDPVWSTSSAQLTTGVMLPHVAALTNGKVLIAGGCPSFNYPGWRCTQQATAAAYLYDPVTDTVATTDAMAVRRSQAAMTRLANGDVLIAGGWELSGQNSSAEVYEVGTGMFRNTGALSHTMHRGTATLLPSGKVLVTAGVYSGATDNLRGWIYDPAANAGVGAFASPVVFQPYYGRFDHSATLLTNGKVLVAGGDNGGSFPGAGASALFDPAAAGGVGAFSAGPPLAQGRAGHAAARLPDGRVLIAGGFFDPGPMASTTLSSAEVYDPVAGTFSALPAMNSEHAFPAFTTLANGAVLIASGANGSCSVACSFPSGITNAVDVFEPSTNQFRVAPVMPASRVGAGSALLSTGSALVVSGVTSETPPYATQLYRLTLDATGTACSYGALCATGNCVDGYCCDQSCTGACKACSAAKKGGGANGACGNVQNGSDPDTECSDQGASTCGTDGACNGLGACRLYASGTVCSASTCTNGTQSSSTCNGSGLCQPTSTSCSPYVCGASTCATTCANDAGCVSNHFCQGTSCVPDKADGQACTASSQCISNSCVDGYCCDSPCNGTCVACSAAKKGSGANGVCGNVNAGVDPDSECSDQGACGLNGQCSGSGSCQYYSPGIPCGSTSCSAGVQTGSSCDGFGTCTASTTTPCAPYVCANASVCGTSCTSDAQCISSHYCQTSTGTCQPDNAPGASCTSASQCASGFCVDGVCCDQACTGTCRACTAALKGSGANGNCGFVGAGADPGGECPDDGVASCDRNGSCNGSGACQLYANGIACAGTTCSNGTQSGYACNGFGDCNPGSTTSCGPYVCANASVCGGSCSADTGCVSSHYCDTDSSCKPDKPNGQACTKSSMCLSGQCVDGVCCDSPCNGTCQACSASKKGSGSDGVCGAVNEDSDPDNDCADQGANSCGFNGTCSGGSTCKYYVTGTACGSTSCAANQQTGYACNGAGQCAAGQVTPCTPYFCQGTACGQTCSTDTECVANHFCSSTSECEPDQSNGQACTKASQCSSGFCVDGFCCNASCNGSCEACSAAKKGQGANGLCGNVSAGADPDNDCTAESPDTCKEDGDCDGAGACEKYGQGTACGQTTCSGSSLSGHVCDGLGTCQTNAVGSCAPYVCVASGNSCNTSCSTDAQCFGGNYCNGTSCDPKKNKGDSCSQNNQCTSNFCVDGVCCEGACTGVCQACASAFTGQADGTCAPALDGEDPHDSCTDQGAEGCDLDGSCDGTGSCRTYPAGSPCGATSCVGNSVTGHLCDGTGSCDSSSNQDCGAYLCQSAGCTTSCTSSAECSATGYCDANGECQEKKGPGQVCSSGDQCGSTFCVDGFCCAGPCTGQCEACDVPAAEGQCVPVSGPPHGDARPACEPAPGDQPCLGSACDGVVRTSCEGMVGPEVGCREASCDPDTGTAIFAASCDGKGACPELQTEKCEPYVCEGSACGKKPCETDADCAAKFRCALTAGEKDCIPKDASTCDGHVVTSPTGQKEDCGAYNCEASGKCKESCSNSTECSPGNFCNTQVSPGRCQKPAGETTDDDGGCGCRIASTGERGSRAGWLLLAGLLLITRRIRSKRPT